MANAGKTNELPSSSRIAQRRPRAAMSVVIVALAGMVSVALGTADTDGFVSSAFDRAMARLDHRQAVAMAEAAPSGDRRFDGVAGSEAFWLGVGDPDVVRTLAVGRAVTIRSGDAEKRLVVTDIRMVGDDNAPRAADEGTTLDPHFAPALPSAAVHGRAADAGRAWLIVCRDVHDPDAGELLLRLQDGRLKLLSPFGHRSL